MEQNIGINKSFHRIFVSAGEVSGDKVLSMVMRELTNKLDGKIQFSGLGGKYCHSSNLDAVYPLAKTAVNGVWDVLRCLPFLISVWHKTRHSIDLFKPELAVLADYPGMNIPIMKYCIKKKIPLYYIHPPQAWLYRKKDLNVFSGIHVHPAFPKDHPYYRNAGAISHAGHFFSLSPQGPASEREFLCLCPGSRAPVIRRNLPILLNLMEKSELKVLKEMTPAILIPSEFHELAGHIVHKSATTTPPMIFDNPAAILPRTAAALSYPGTMTLELALRDIPTVVICRIDILTYWIAKMKLKTGWVSLPNNLLNREVFPEIISVFFQASQKTFDQSFKKALAVSEIYQVKDQIGQEGGAETAATACCALLADCGAGHS